MPKINNGDLSFTAKLWQTADKLRNNMDAAEYKHVVLGLIFLKYISDAFEEKHEVLESEVADSSKPSYIDDPQARYETLVKFQLYSPPQFQIYSPLFLV